MFDQLSDKLLGTIQKIKGQGVITEKNIEDAVKEIRLSLLEADVNFSVVKDFIAKVKEKALGSEVIRHVHAGQQFVKIVHEELKIVLGEEATPLVTKGPLSVIFLVGLQGVGKTTTASKLSLFIRKNIKKKPGLVPADIYRPAAIDQLKTLAKTNGVPVYPTVMGQRPEEIVLEAIKWAKEELIEVLIVDTAGRLQIDSDLMGELRRIKEIAQPQEILLVADAMLGQQSVNVAEGFHKDLGLTGLILTKVDGDARGGAALSIRQTVGIPIKFLGVGEKAKDLEIFHPDRLASRVLDMGDVLTLVEKAQEVIDEKEAKSSAQKLLNNQFTVEDFLKQIQMMKKMGGMQSLMKLIPGMSQLSKQIEEMAPPDQEIRKIEAIIRSMTLIERQDLKILNGSRRLRIAQGSGTEVKDVNKFVKQFEESKKMMSQMMKMGLGGGKKGFRMPF